jgi:hypothetical protein
MIAMKEASSAQARSAAVTTAQALDVKAFAIACALIWGIGLLALTWWVMAFDGATGQPTLIGHVYRGYSISPLGSLIGLLWATPDGLIGGAIFAWLYNSLARRF